MTDGGETQVKIVQKQPSLLAHALAILVIVSLIVLIGIRLYTIYETVAIRTWDDIEYRNYAIEYADFIDTFSKAIQDIIFPNGNLLDNSRAIGYHSWLVLFVTLKISGNPEQVFQWANFVLWLIQGFILYRLALWATQTKTVAGTLVILYLACPIVFGLNRWVMTENFVMTGLLVLSYVPIGILWHDYRPRYRWEILAGIGGAWGMALFGTMREYALPSYLLLMVVTSGGLFWQRRLDAFFGFTITAIAFWLTYLEGWIKLMKLSAFRVSQSEYFHPLREWIPHFFSQVIGYPLAVFLGILLVIIGRKLYQYYHQDYFSLSALRQKFNLDSLRRSPDWLGLLVLAHGLLLMLYCAIVLISSSRQARAGILILWTGMPLILIALRYLAIDVKVLRQGWFTTLMIMLILATWSASYHQLFVAFDDGKTYFHKAYDLEIYNYPLHIRALSGPDDMHTRPYAP